MLKVQAFLKQPTFTREKIFFFFVVVFGKFLIEHHSCCINATCIFVNINIYSFNKRI